VADPLDTVDVTQPRDRPPDTPTVPGTPRPRAPAFLPQPGEDQAFLYQQLEALLELCQLGQPEACDSYAEMTRSLAGPETLARIDEINRAFLGPLPVQPGVEIVAPRPIAVPAPVGPPLNFGVLGLVGAGLFGLAEIADRLSDAALENAINRITPPPPGGRTTTAEDEPPPGSLDWEALSRPGWRTNLSESLREVLGNLPRELLRRFGDYWPDPLPEVLVAAPRLPELIAPPLEFFPIGLPMPDLFNFPTPIGAPFPAPAPEPAPAPTPTFTPTLDPFPIELPMPQPFPIPAPLAPPAPFAPPPGIPFAPPTTIPTPVRPTAPLPIPTPVGLPSPFPTPTGNPLAQPFPAPTGDPFPVPGTPTFPQTPTGLPTPTTPPRPAAPPSSLASPFQPPSPFADPFKAPPRQRNRDCKCPPKKKPEKKKPRTICYRGSYREYANGLAKFRKERISCQPSKSKAR